MVCSLSRKFFLPLLRLNSWSPSQSLGLDLNVTLSEKPFPDLPFWTESLFLLPQVPFLLALIPAVT